MRAEGIEAFFSEKDLSKSVFRDEIDESLDEAQILIVVGRNKEHLEANNVKYEWQSFHHDLLNNRKSNGDIYTYLEGLDKNVLPRPLRMRQSFSSKQKSTLIERIKLNFAK